MLKGLSLDQIIKYIHKKWRTLPDMRNQDNNNLTYPIVDVVLSASNSNSRFYFSYTRVNICFLHENKAKIFNFVQLLMKTVPYFAKNVQMVKYARKSDSHSTGC